MSVVDPVTFLGCPCVAPECVLLGDQRNLVLVLDTEGRVTYAGQPGLQTLPENIRDLDGIRITDWIHPEDQGIFKKTLASVLDEGNPGIVTFRIVSGQSAPRTFEAILRPAVQHDPEKRVIAIAHDITEMCMLEDRFRRTALLDELTGLANRRLMYERFDHLLDDVRSRPAEIIAVMLLDLDRFALINNALGHQTGDDLLRSVAQRLTSSAIDFEAIGRLGADEFLLLAHARDFDDVTRITAELCSAMSAGFPTMGQVVQISGSIGVALAPAHGLDRHMLMKRADIALRRAKLRPGWSAARFDGAIEELTERRAYLEAKLREHLAAGRLQVGYQPIVHLERPGLAGFEALLRYDRDLGARSVEEVINVAEECGLIGSVDEFVIKKAIAVGERLNACNSDDLLVSVNISPVFMRDNDLPEFIDRVLKTSALSPNCLQLEITERVMIEHPEVALETLGAVRRRGVRIALDDFGVGYSSLTHLHRFPIQCLKIDKSFTMDLPHNARTRAIVEAITMAARRLRLAVVAEGIETHEQEAAALQAGCTEGQGYLYGRALPEEQLIAVVEGWPSFL